ncbi:MAG: heavy metal translocating P-type ATPase metal-binding domain-containing protein, partial [Flavobacteriales bacterium]
MNCYHCGDPCESASEVIYKTQHFCCFGCRTVFEILETNDLDTYYDLEHFPGLKTELNHKDQFAFLDVDEFKQRWIRFENDNLTKVSFHIPQIHCSACIWLLENLTRLHKGISSAFVNFSSRRVDISFNNQDISLREVVELLSAIGYQPNLHDKLETSANANINRSLYYKIGVAGFCFGNIMLLAFPEYLGIDASYEQFRAFFGYISLILTLPVFFYAGFGYLRNAWKGIQQRFINMDIPIALGMITLLIRSSYEIISATGAGYFDSLSGLVFFLLLGQWFQKKTYDTLS